MYNKWENNHPEDSEPDTRHASDVVGEHCIQQSLFESSEFYTRPVGDPELILHIVEGLLEVAIILDQSTVGQHEWAV